MRKHALPEGRASARLLEEKHVRPKRERRFPAGETTQIPAAGIGPTIWDRPVLLKAA